MNDKEQLPLVPRGTFWGEVWRYLTACLSRENYARMQGRAGRLEYWSFTLVATFFTLVPLIFLLIPSLLALYISLSCFVAAMFYFAMPMLAVYVRRLHDVGLSGWLIALQYVTFCVPFSYVVFILTSLLFTEPDLLANPDEILYILAAEMRESWMFYVQSTSEIISFVLFIFTIVPGNQGFNRYGKP